MMAGPVLFGGLLPGLVEILRRSFAHRGSRRRMPSLPQLDRDLGADAPRFTAVGRSPSRAHPSLTDDTPLAVQATKIRAAEQSVEDLRRVIFTPLPSQDMDLAPALDLLALRFGQHAGVSARVTLLGRTRVVSPIHRRLLVRLAQESLLNVQQHAHAGSAVLTLRYDASSVALLIQDDGVGLLDGTHERPGLHALRAMQYRLTEFGGRLDVFETEGGGVTVRATMPLE
jgi:signal transduction histidine kinase